VLKVCSGAGAGAGAGAAAAAAAFCNGKIRCRNQVNLTNVLVCKVIKREPLKAYNILTYVYIKLLY